MCIPLKLFIAKPCSLAFEMFSKLHLFNFNYEMHVCMFQQLRQLKFLPLAQIQEKQEIILAAQIPLAQSLAQTPARFTAAGEQHELLGLQLALMTYLRLIRMSLRQEMLYIRTHTNINNVCYYIIAYCDSDKFDTTFVIRKYEEFTL